MHLGEAEQQYPLKCKLSGLIERVQVRSRGFKDECSKFEKRRVKKRKQ